MGGQKGGTGKSNCAVYFVGRGLDVILLDDVPQATVAKFCDRRNEVGQLPVVNFVQKTGDVAKAVLDLEKRCDLIIIDAGGRDSKELPTALAVAEVVFVPLA